LSFTGKIYFRILGLGLGSVALALALHVCGLGLDSSGLVNIPAYHWFTGHWVARSPGEHFRSGRVMGRCVKPVV